MGLFIIFILFLNSSCVNLLMGLENWKWPSENGFCRQHAGGERGLCSPVWSQHPKSHPAVGISCCQMCLSVPSIPRSAPGPWHMPRVPQTLFCHRASSCNWAACAWWQLLAVPAAPDGAFLAGWGLALILFFFSLECAGPCKQPRLYGKSPCHPLQGFGSTESCTVLVLGCAQSRDSSLSMVCALWDAAHPSCSVRSAWTPLQQVSGCCRQCPVPLEGQGMSRQHRGVHMAWITDSLTPPGSQPALHWYLSNVHSAEDAPWAKGTFNPRQQLLLPRINLLMLLKRTHRAAAGFC